METTKLYPIWRELVKVANGWEYGTLHTHEEISGIIGVPPKTNRYYNIVRRAKTDLIQYGKLFDTYVDKGYQVIEINRYNEKTFEDIRKAKKHLDLSVIMSQHAPVDKMDAGTRGKHDVFLVKQVGLLNMFTPKYVEITKVIAPIDSRFRIKEAKPKSEEPK